MKLNSSVLNSVVLSLFLSFSFFVWAQDDEVAMIDTSTYGSTEIEIKEALIYAALHYQWEIISHARDEIRLEYKKNPLKLVINGAKITAYGDQERLSDHPRWIISLKKLAIRRLMYLAELRKAQSFIQ